ncbi:hypothetical protein EDB92DRAFT_1819002 [Lactarius akahatsu]|uniref:Uncharacterized protein n=1 Tax=Lactarius akahatsu TaxID=416441 RepID=A0AAD4QAI6_9AGAM|nr:hypothetical protein EDB92DRAFT_1819002 [Lactarius akahatsu]
MSDICSQESTSIGNGHRIELCDYRGAAWSERCKYRRLRRYSYDRTEPLDDAVAGFSRGIGKVTATTAEVQYLALPRLTPRCIRLRSSTPTMVHRDLSMAAGAVSEMSREIPAEEGPSRSSAEEQNHLKVSSGGNKSYVGRESGTAVRVYVNRRSRGLRPTDKGATSMASANCAQNSGYEIHPRNGSDVQNTLNWFHLRISKGGGYTHILAPEAKSLKLDTGTRWVKYLG